MTDEQKRSEFIPLGYNEEGKVIDVMDNIRNVEAIPYALDNIYVHIRYEGSPFETAREILRGFIEDSEISDEFKELFKKDLEGRVGFIVGPRTNDETTSEGTWAPVQFYRIKD